MLIKARSKKPSFDSSSPVAAACDFSDSVLGSGSEWGSNEKPIEGFHFVIFVALVTSSTYIVRKDWRVFVVVS
jgi:hypothetical protein